MKFINYTQERLLWVAPWATIDCLTLPEYKEVIDEEGNKKQELVRLYPNPVIVKNFEEAWLTLLVEWDVVEWEIIE